MQNPRSQNTVKFVKAHEFLISVKIFQNLKHCRFFCKTLLKLLVHFEILSNLVPFTQ